MRRLYADGIANNKHLEFKEDVAHEYNHRYDDSLFVRGARMLYALIMVRFVNIHGSILSWTTAKIEKRKFLRIVTCFRQYAAVAEHDCSAYQCARAERHTVVFQTRCCIYQWRLLILHSSVLNIVTTYTSLISKQRLIWHKPHPKVAIYIYKYVILFNFLFS